MREEQPSHKSLESLLAIIELARRILLATLGHAPAGPPDLDSILPHQGPFKIPPVSILLMAMLPQTSIETGERMKQVCEGGL